MMLIHNSPFHYHFFYVGSDYGCTNLGNRLCDGLCTNGGRYCMNEPGMMNTTLPMCSSVLSSLLCNVIVVANW